MKTFFIFICTMLIYHHSYGDQQSAISPSATWNVDLIVRSENANAAVRLLESIENREDIFFNISGGPFDKAQELYATLQLCFSFLSENTLDSRWGKLARISAHDTKVMAEMILSEDAGERILALMKLLSLKDQEGLTHELKALSKDDPLVYFAYKRRGIKRSREMQRDETPNYGSFIAPIRTMARTLLRNQGEVMESEEAFKKRYEEFGVERLIELFSYDDPLMNNGILGVFLKMNPQSYGGQYMESREQHEKISKESLYLLKQHLNKKMDIRTGLVCSNKMSAIRLLLEDRNIKATYKNWAHTSVNTRLDAVKKLGTMDDIEGFNMLKNILKNDEENWNIKLNAARSLAKMENQEVLDLLVDNLGYECEVIREKLSPPIKKSYGTEDEIVEKKTRAVLQEYVSDSPNKKQHLIRLNQKLNMTHNLKQKYYLSMVLGECGDKVAVPILIQCLEESENVLMREDAARILGDLNDKSAINSLITALHDDDVLRSTGDVVGKSYGYVVRRAAAQSLKKLGVTVVDVGNDIYNISK